MLLDPGHLGQGMTEYGRHSICALFPTVEVVNIWGSKCAEQILWQLGSFSILVWICQTFLRAGSFGKAKYCKSFLFLVLLLQLGAEQPGMVALFVYLVKRYK